MLPVMPRTRALLELTPGIAGADEAGRGPLAGPVVCAAVLLPESFDRRGIQDSKTLTPTQREFQAARIRQAAEHAVIFIEPEEIDRLNILRASLEGLRRAILALPSAPSRALIDGNQGLDIPGVEVTACVKGDGTYACIAAASILAKVARDAAMREAAAAYPQYGFDRHFGYPTPEHLTALAEHGPCPIHRRSYAPVRAALENGPHLAR